MARKGNARSVTLRLDLSPAGTIVPEQDLARDAERYGDFLRQTKALAPGADTHYAKAMQTGGGRREKAPHEVEAITAMARLHRKQGLYQVKVRKSAETAKIEFASARKIHDTLLKLDPTDWVQQDELSETLMHLCRAALTLHDFPLVMETS